MANHCNIINEWYVVILCNSRDTKRLVHTCIHLTDSYLESSLPSKDLVYSLVKCRQDQVSKGFIRIVLICFSQKDIEINSSTKIQRLTRTIQEQESILILAEPRLRFTISTKKGDQYCFLLPSDYERREWQESLQSLKAKCRWSLERSISERGKKSSPSISMMS